MNEPAKWRRRNLPLHQQHRNDDNSDSDHVPLSVHSSSPKTNTLYVGGKGERGQRVVVRWISGVPILILGEIISLSFLDLKRDLLLLLLLLLKRSPLCTAHTLTVPTGNY